MLHPRQRGMIRLLPYRFDEAIEKTTIRITAFGYLKIARLFTTEQKRGVAKKIRTFIKHSSVCNAQVNFEWGIVQETSVDLRIAQQTQGNAMDLAANRFLAAPGAIRRFGTGFNVVTRVIAISTEINQRIARPKLSFK
jgi:hypothetical protein